MNGESALALAVGSSSSQAQAVLEQHVTGLMKEALNRFGGGPGGRK
jgi:hypothetical protein